MYFSNWWLFFWDFRGLSSSPTKEENFTLGWRDRHGSQGETAGCVKVHGAAKCGSWWIFGLLFLVSLQLGRFSRKGTELPQHPDRFPGLSQQLWSQPWTR